MFEKYIDCRLNDTESFLLIGVFGGLDGKVFSIVVLAIGLIL